MKIAIMGAGLSGTACGYGLQSLGLKFDIYEQLHMVGARFANMEAILQILHKPYKDCFDFLDDNYGLRIQGISPISRLVIHGPTTKAIVEGELGYLTARGNHSGSLEVQISQQLDTKINFDAFENLDDLRRAYDYVVVAIGNPRETRRLDNWETDVPVNLMGATIRGKFHEQEVSAWFNNDFAPKGYCWLLPYNSSVASLAMGIPGEPRNLEPYWQKFLSSLDFEFEIKDTFLIYNYKMGRVKRREIDGTYFVGNAGGHLLPFLGFGQFSSMVAGLEVAYSIAERCGISVTRKREGVLEQLDTDYKDSLALRKALELLDNDNLDRLVETVSKDWAKKVFDKDSLPLINYLGKALKPFLT